MGALEATKLCTAVMLGLAVQTPVWLAEAMALVGRLVELPVAEATGLAVMVVELLAASAFVGVWDAVGLTAMLAVADWVGLADGRVVIVVDMVGLAVVDTLALGVRVAVPVEVRLGTTGLLVALLLGVLLGVAVFVALLVGSGH